MDKVRKKEDDEVARGDWMRECLVVGERFSLYLVRGKFWIRDVITWANVIDFDIFCDVLGTSMCQI